MYACRVGGYIGQSFSRSNSHDAVSVVEMLLAAGADPLVTDARHMTPLMHAANQVSKVF